MCHTALKALDLLNTTCAEPRTCGAWARTETVLCREAAWGRAMVDLVADSIFVVCVCVFERFDLGFVRLL